VHRWKICLYGLIVEEAIGWVQSGILDENFPKKSSICDMGSEIVDV
jgi:hypothetical protein